MKRTKPLPGEMTIRHTTEQTGDTQTFAVCPENFDPAILAVVPGMQRRAMGGYRLSVVRNVDAAVVGFDVLRDIDGAVLTTNRVGLDGATVVLETSIRWPMEKREAILVADLEQCAALSLLGVGF